MLSLGEEGAGWIQANTKQQEGRREGACVCESGGRGRAPTLRAATLTVWDALASPITVSMPVQVHS